MGEEVIRVQMLRDVVAVGEVRLGAHVQVKAVEGAELVPDGRVVRYRQCIGHVDGDGPTHVGRDRVRHGPIPGADLQQHLVRTHERPDEGGLGGGRGRPRDRIPGALHEGVVRDPLRPLPVDERVEAAALLHPGGTTQAIGELALDQVMLALPRIRGHHRTVPRPRPASWFRPSPRAPARGDGR